MIAEEQEALHEPRQRSVRTLAWINLALTITLLAAGLWYLRTKIMLADVVQALLLSQPGFIFISLVMILLTLIIKTWRWQLLLPLDKERGRFRSLFWAIMLGQYVNLLVPFLRLGEVARIYAINRQAGVSKARSLSTLVVEKTLELIMLGMTMLVLFYMIVLPEYLGNSVFFFSTLALIVLLLSYVFAFQTRLVVAAATTVARRLPQPLGKRFVNVVVSGLEGLSALRDRRTLLHLILLSILITILSILTPWTIFLAFDISFGFIEAALINVVMSLALAPPSTPGKLVVFDGTVVFLLVQLGLRNEGAIAGYTIVYHLVVLLPKLILGSIAASRTDWRWRRRPSL